MPLFFLHNSEFYQTPLCAWLGLQNHHTVKLTEALFYLNSTNFLHYTSAKICELHAGTLEISNFLLKLHVISEIQRTESYHGWSTLRFRLDQAVTMLVARSGSVCVHFSSCGDSTQLTDATVSNQENLENHRSTRFVINSIL